MSRIDWDYVLELAEQGLAPIRIAERCGCHRSTISRVLRQRQRSIPGSIDRDAVARLTAAGLSAAQIARTLGCTPRSVTRVRTKLGIAGPPPRHLSAEEVERAEALLADGCSVHEIERTLGRSRGSLAHRFRGRGWDRSEASSFALFCRYTEERTRPSNVGPIR